MHKLWRPVTSQSGRLLCLLFLRQRSLPTEAAKLGGCDDLTHIQMPEMSYGMIDGNGIIRLQRVDLYFGDNAEQILGVLAGLEAG